MKALALIALAGCASTFESTSARTLDPGAYEVTGALGATEAGIAGGDRSPPLPLVELGVRRGLGDHVDVGAKLFEAGAQLDVKVQLERAERWSVALAPGVGYLFPMLASVVTAQLPVLVGYTFADGSELVVGPRAIGLFGPYDHASFDVALGSTLGFAWRVNARWKIMPELSVQRTVRDPVWGAGGGIALRRAL